jgi:pantoate--beta-alanine ligase
LIILKNVKEWQKIRHSLGEKSIGFVPTMGCLHIGHASLLSKSVAENDLTVLSLFVNPTQFNNPDDYKNYPKTLENDLKMAEALKVDYVLFPDEAELYPEGNHIYFETNHPLSTILEGQYRPGHFGGVLTIVMKLLLLVRPKRAYFGEKDYQQYQLIKSLARNYFIETEIIGCPIIREKSGLACSSRNQRLSASQHEIAEHFANLFLNHSTENLNDFKKAFSHLDLTIEYLEIYGNRVFCAVKIGDIRLIDNRQI